MSEPAVTARRVSDDTIEVRFTVGRVVRGLRLSRELALELAEQLTTSAADEQPQRKEADLK